MTSICSLLSFMTAVALFCCGCRTAAPGYRSLSNSEIALHPPTRLAFPLRIGPFQRSFAQQKLDDPKSIRVGYSYEGKHSPNIITITVERSNVSPAEMIWSLKQAFTTANPDAAISAPLSADSPALLHDWQTVAIDYYGFVADFPPSMRHQPQRRLYGARTYGGYTLLLDSTPFYPDFGNVILPATDRLVSELFPN
ncbi:hypothetical protein [Pedosphaera parvula]|nr:hypothetical protein [Pedosphaera parvula]